MLYNKTCKEELAWREPNDQFAQHDGFDAFRRIPSKHFFLPRGSRECATPREPPARDAAIPVPCFADARRQGTSLSMAYELAAECCHEMSSLRTKMATEMPDAASIELLQCIRSWWRPHQWHQGNETMFCFSYVVRLQIQVRCTFLDRNFFGPANLGGSWI